MSWYVLELFLFSEGGGTKFAAEANPKESYQQLLKNVREILRKNYSQKPQLSSSHKIVRPLILHSSINCLP